MSISVTIEDGETSVSYLYSRVAGQETTNLFSLLADLLPKTMKKDGRVVGRMYRIEFSGPTGGRSIPVPPEN